jgi:hypothetical protein
MRLFRRREARKIEKLARVLVALDSSVRPIRPARRPAI